MDHPHSQALRDRDAALIRRAARGELAAFDELYELYSDWVWILALRSTGNHSDAQDVLQDAFAWLLRRLPELELSARLSTLLYPVVRHLARDLAAKAQRQRATAGDNLEEHSASAPSPQAVASKQGLVAQGLEREDLERVVRALPPGQREVLLMRTLDELSLEEIALALDIPEGTVKSRLHHALRSLRADPVARRYFLGG